MDEFARNHPSLDRKTLSLSRGRRLRDALQSREMQVEVRAAELREATDRAVEAVTSTASAAISDVQNRVTSALASIAPERPPSAEEEERLLSELSEAAAVHSSHLASLRESLLRLAGGDSDPTQMLRDYVQDLEQQAERNLELLQLGQAVQVVSHEFESTIKSVRFGLRQLDPWARANPQLRDVVQDIKSGFQHLDGYLRLFTPLQRRLYRRRVIITGNEIARFVTGVFTDRLPRHRIELHTTPTFSKFTLTGFPSTFYPVFVNLVDNAIHWVALEREEGGRITLDAEGPSMLIRDNGPGVRPRDVEAIFDRGFSRRRGGRGLGLTIARDLLLREGWSLELDAPIKGRGAQFRISPIEVAR
ncbi:sensor histidine kinase [Blastococcus sp. CT_GayMR20]|uniref:ATP-binding protein n=1 Tax=Blastococcus sp. CT_GayMR20 TaxID=2559609 RepID=UPI001073499E|nr:ATP-binding protein [Blastococcus sp. CT_GayMR20]TFV82798.1 sensor histidine kinase [Blastococcus sp. CT_GayMR20]